MQKPPQEILQQTMRLHPDGEMDQATALHGRKLLADDFRAQLTIGVPTDQDEASLRRLAAQLRLRKYALQYSAFKAHFLTQSEYGGEPSATHPTPELYNLDQDPSEKWNVAAHHPEVVIELLRLAEEHKKGIPPVQNHLDSRIATRK